MFRVCQTYKIWYLQLLRVRAKDSWISIRIMRPSAHGLLFQWASTIMIQLSVLV